MERALIEYIANALWQIPLLAAGCWLLVRAAKPGVVAQHCLWLGVLTLAVLLPARGIRTAPAPDRAIDLSNVGTRSQMYSGTEAGGLLLQNGVGAAEQHWVQLPMRVQNVRLTATVAHVVTGLYLTLAVFGLVRIGLAWRAAQQLVKGSRPLTLASSNMDALRNYGHRFRVGLPQLREAEAVSSPMIVRVSRPVMLLPRNFCQHTEDEIKAAFCHELAHLRRHDYLVNLICELAALPVAWHPVTRALQLRIRRTREMVCDAIAAREMCSEIGYAKCLMALAQKMVHGRALAEQAQALGLFNNNTLEERIMRLMEKKAVTSLRARVARVAVGLTGMASTILVAAVLHVTPVMAATDAEQQAAAVPPDAQAQMQPAPAESATAPGDKTKLKELQKGSNVRVRIGKVVVKVDDDAQELTTNEKCPVEARKQKIIVDGWLRSDEFKRQMEDVKRQLAETRATFESPEFRRQMEAARKQALDAALHNEELKKQMAELQRKLQSKEFKKQVEEARRQALDTSLHSEELKKQMAELHRQLQSGEFKREMEKATQAMKDLQEQLKNKPLQ